MYLFLWVVISTSSFVWSLLCNYFVYFSFETLVILSAILLPIKSPVASAVFLNCSFRCWFYCICSRILVLSKSFWPYLLLKLLPMFLAKDNISFHIYSISWFSWISHFYILHLTTIVKFILSSISNDWLFWSANHTIISSYFGLNVFKDMICWRNF